MFRRTITPPLLWAIFIFVVCGIPGDEIPDLSIWNLQGMDKFVHAFLFCFQTFLLIIAFKKQSTYPSIKYFSKTYALVISTVYGMVIEGLQWAIFLDRSADLFDLIFNVLGSFIGILFFRVIYGREFF